jgi:hypothetical protein
MSPDILLYRVVSVAFVHRSDITLQVFQPRQSGEKLLHVYNGERVSADEAWNDFIRLSHTPPKYIGVVGVTVSECESLSLAVQESVYDPVHAQIDFSHLTHSEIRRRAHALKELANARGWLFRPL